MNAGMLLGVIYLIVRVAMLVAIFYFVVVELLRERRKK